MLNSLFVNSFPRTALAFLTALVVSLVVGAWLIRFFRRKGVIEDTTQPDHAGLNAIQSQKRNVPTMGGLMILAAIVIATMLWADLHSAYLWIGMLVLIVLGVAGFLDDYIKLKRKPSRGLSKAQKLVVQFVLGGMVGYLLMQLDLFEPRVGRLPWYGTGNWHLGWGYIPWCSIFMAAASNAVNLTDGLDGLAGGLALIAAIALIIGGALLWADLRIEIFILCLAMAGALLGFLWYNAHPAQIFMGDTGSLALGGLLAYVALAWRVELFLLALCAPFFAEELTVAMQIASFQLTGRRIFPITPIHHHFQVNLNWPEQKIVARAWILGILSAVLAILIVDCTI